MVESKNERILYENILSAGLELILKYVRVLFMIHTQPAEIKKAIKKKYKQEPNNSITE